jgi:cytohesin
MIEFLLDQGADPNARMVDGKTPLGESISGSDEETKGPGRIASVQTLLNRGANPSTPDVAGRAPLHWACFYGQERVVRLLVAVDADVRASDDDLITPLHLACLAGNLEIVQMLRDKGADSGALDDQLRTPLHYAAKGGSLQVCQYLIDHANANPDASDGAGMMALHMADGTNTAEIQDVLQKASNARRDKLRTRAAGDEP